MLNQKVFTTRNRSSSSEGNNEHPTHVVVNRKVNLSESVKKDLLRMSVAEVIGSS